MLGKKAMQKKDAQLCPRAFAALAVLRQRPGDVSSLWGSLSLQLFSNILRSSFKHLSSSFPSCRISSLIPSLHHFYSIPFIFMCPPVILSPFIFHIFPYLYFISSTTVSSVSQIPPAAWAHRLQHVASARLAGTLPGQPWPGEAQHCSADQIQKQWGWKLSIVFCLCQFSVSPQNPFLFPLCPFSIWKALKVEEPKSEDEKLMIRTKKVLYWFRASTWFYMVLHVLKLEKRRMKPLSSTAKT